MCDRLLKEGHAVVALDNFLTGLPSNIAHLAQQKHFRFQEQDVSAPFEIDGKFDAVMHMASPGQSARLFGTPRSKRLT